MEKMNIEKAASKDAHETLEKPWVTNNNSAATMARECRESFINGANYVLEQASEGFEEFSSQDPYLKAPSYEETWQAARIPLLKEIEGLKENIKSERNDVLYMDKQCAELKEENKKLREALDIATRKIILNGEEIRFELRQKFNLDKKED